MNTWRRWRWLSAGGILALSVALSRSILAQGGLEAVPFDRKLVASTGAASERFGSTLAVSGDTLVITAPSATVDGKLFAGAAYIFVRDPLSGVWAERRRLVAQDGVAVDQLGGSSVAVAGDTVFLGVSRAKVGDVLQQGAVYVFERHAGGADNWGQTAKLTDDTVGAIGNFGSSIAIEGDVLVVGASRGGGNGQVTVFERDRGGPGAWGKVTAINDTAVADGGTPLESFGGAVALAGDVLVVGAGAADVSFFGEDDGAAYVFRRDAVNRDRWAFVTRLTAPEATLCPGGRTLAQISLESLEVRLAVQRCALETSKTDHDGFGGRVATDGDTIVVAAAGAEAASGPVVGAVYVFRRDPAGADRWDQVAKVTGGDILSSTSPGFGGAVALRGDTLLVGASGVDVGVRTDQGAAYRFERHAGGAELWGQTAKLVAGDGLSRENFGRAVALDGVDGIIAASGYEVGQGAVYLAGEPPDVSQEPAFSVTGELVTDGMVVGPQGALLAAVGSPLSAPLPIWIHEVPPPAEPVLTHMTPIGNFFNVGAAQTTLPPVDLPFALALPVPPGADPSHLAIAKLVPTNGILGAGAGPSWFPVRGFYNPDVALFSVVLPALFIEGTTVVLVEHPDLTPLTEIATGALTPRFEIWCDGFTDPTQCKPADKLAMSSLLQLQYEDFVRLGVGDKKTPQDTQPRLGLLLQSSAVESRNGNLVVSLVLSTQYQVRALQKAPPQHADCTGVAGFYIPVDRSLTLCYPGSISPEFTLAVRHELFHAFQGGFPPFYADWTDIAAAVTPTNLVAADNVYWILEGTAAAAEVSGDRMHRTTSTVPPLVALPLHPIDRALTASDSQIVNGKLVPGLIPYQAQDFWVYVGKTVGSAELGLAYLNDLFARGASPDAANTLLTQVHGTSLAEEYWQWVKNQVIEKTNLLDGALAHPCSFASVSEAVMGTPDERSFPVSEGPPQLPAPPLERLSARVVRITMERDVGNIKVELAGGSLPDPPDPNLKYKVYVDNETCADTMDGARPLDPLTKGSVVFIVLANTSYQEGTRAEYTVKIEFTK